jgi:osmotically-inducible protein OsmY
LENFSGLEIACDRGCVTVGGRVDRRSRCDLAIAIAALVSGVVEVRDELDWRWDDTELTPARAKTDAQVVRSELGASLAKVAPE